MKATMESTKGKRLHLPQPTVLRMHDQTGVAALEMALIAPVLIAMLFGVIEFGSIMFLQTNMETAARETVRQIAVGAITSGQAPAEAQKYLANWNGLTFTVTTNAPTNPSDVAVQISIPLSQAALVNVLGIFTSGNLSAQSTMRNQNI